MRGGETAGTDGLKVELENVVNSAEGKECKLATKG